MANKLPAKGRSKSKGNSFDRWLIAGIIISLIAIVLFLWSPLRKYLPGEEKKPAALTKQAEQDRQAGRKDREKTESESSAKRSGQHALIAIVIDDLGQDIKQAQEVLSLPGNMSFAVMPGLPQSRKIAILARQNGSDVLLHLPMEPINRNGKPTPIGTLRSDMTPMEFMTTLSEDIESVPGARGVNNHEGSALTENKEAMKFLMAELKVRDLFFVDSRTNPKSMAFSTAREFGLKAAKRDIFLDNEINNPEYVRGRLEELVRIARKNGTAIAIGHPHPVTINELRKWLPTADEQNIEIVPVSKLLQEK